MISLPPGVYSAKVIFGLAGFRYLQGTCAGSGEIQGKDGEEEEGGLAHTPDGSLKGNQPRQGDSGAGDGKLPSQNNTGRSPVAALDSQDRRILGSAAAGQNQGSLLADAAAAPNDTVALDPHHPHIGHQVDFHLLLLGCNQVAAQEGPVGEGEVIRCCPLPFPHLALSPAPLHCLPCTVQMPFG